MLFLSFKKKNPLESIYNFTNISRQPRRFHFRRVFIVSVTDDDLILSNRQMMHCDARINLSRVFPVTAGKEADAD